MTAEFWFRQRREGAIKLLRLFLGLGAGGGSLTVGMDPLDGGAVGTSNLGMCSRIGNAEKLIVIKIAGRVRLPFRFGQCTVLCGEKRRRWWISPRDCTRGTNC